ncbi:homeobox-leucine zipper protein ATHB-40-like, partial [Trifolium pratense]
VLKLREQLCEAEKEIHRLREPIENVTSNSSSTSSMSQSMEVVDPPFLGEFGVDYGYDDDVFLVPNETQYFNGMDWVTLYV